MNPDDKQELIEELQALMNELGKVLRGYEPPKCNPVIINPSTGIKCHPKMVSVNLANDEDPMPLVEAFGKWIADLIKRYK